MLKFSLMLASAVCACLNLSAALAVDGVTVVPHRPWDKQVDVFVKLSGAEDETEYKVQLTANYTGCPTGGLVAKALAGDPVVKGDGTHRLVWNLNQDAPGLIADDFVVTADVTPYAPTDPMYLVIDLSAGPEATSYPSRYSFTAPDLTDDACRTTELWLKRCPAGTFTEGKGNGNAASLPAHTVRLTKPFYMAIFETTQKQWERVMGNWPSFFANEAYRDTRPVEQVTWSEIRGSHGGWYDGNTGSPTATSFIGRMRTRTGEAKLDLPSEAQWEYACRGGTTGDLYYNGTQADATKYARTCGWNDTGKSTDPQQDLSKGTARVGSYPANPWGFYDFYGNVTELVPDGNNRYDWTSLVYDDVTVDPKACCAADVGNTSAVTEKGSGNNDQAGQVNSYKHTARATSVAGSKNRGFRICVNAE